VLLFGGAFDDGRSAPGGNRHLVKYTEKEWQPDRYRGGQDQGTKTADAI
jgi:hypothetical protein